jgi:hypothetical protein
MNLFRQTFTTGLFGEGQRDEPETLRRSQIRLALL